MFYERIREILPPQSDAADHLTGYSTISNVQCNVQPVCELVASYMRLTHRVDDLPIFHRTAPNGGIDPEFPYQIISISTAAHITCECQPAHSKLPVNSYSEVAKAAPEKRAQLTLRGLCDYERKVSTQERTNVGVRLQRREKDCTTADLVRGANRERCHRWRHSGEINLPE